MTETIDLEGAEHYLNEHLSQLHFNQRVLELSYDERIPLLERLKFLCISCTNMDEYFEVRVAGLKQQLLLNREKIGLDGLSTLNTLSRITEQARQQVDEQYRVLNDILLPSLHDQSVRFLKRADWSEAQADWLADYFTQDIYPVLSPLGLDPSHPFPRVLNKSLNLIVTMKGDDSFKRESGIAVVQAPRSLPRLIRLPHDLSSGPDDFVFLSSVLHEHVGKLFPGMEVLGTYQFRVTRNSHLFVDEEAIDDLLSALKGELPSRHLGQSVRLELSDSCPEDLSLFLLKKLHLEEQDLYRVNGPVNLNRLLAVNDLVDRPDLKYLPYTPSLPPQITGEPNIFSALQQGDLLLHHPYQSFGPVIEFIRQAAEDSQVLAIKQTLYRTGADSAIVNALLQAAKAGKEVTVVIELRARFDEEANISLADRLHVAGCQVVYGIVGYKTHAKLAMVVRREQGKIVRYVHVGSGNYHAATARCYSDFGLLSRDQELGEDVHTAFMQLTGFGSVGIMKKLVMAPFNLFDHFVTLIDREIKNANANKPAYIMLRMNALIEPKIIRALYRASQAGVRIDIIVRGMCCLRPGVAGVSDNIFVRSVLGRFLEHSRVYYFANNGKPELYFGSADWMSRNLFNRVEIVAPIINEELRQRVVDESLINFLRDNTHAWVLQADGSWLKSEPGPGEDAFSAQQNLLENLAKH